MQSIKSPFTPVKVTKEVLDKVKEMTQASCVFVVVSNEQLDHECQPGKCQGHYLNFNSDGFSLNQILGISAMIADDAGYRLIDKDEKNGD